MAETVEPWRSLVPGDCFIVRNRRGELYEPSFLASGPPEAGLYVRHRGAIGRLHPDHFDAATFERLLGGEVLVRGDQVLLEIRTKTEEVLETRGTFLELRSNSVVIAMNSLERPSTFPLRDLMSGSLRLLLPTKTLHAGEEFMAVTRDGMAIRGVASAMNKGSFGIQPLDGSPPIEVPLADLNSYTINVLIPVPLAASEESFY